MNPFRTKNYTAIILFALGLWCCLAFRGKHELSLQWSQDFLAGHYNPEADALKLKKADLQVTPDGFFRLKKTLQAGKQEYFSFHLKKLQAVDYLGTAASGWVILETAGDHIIVQTFNDRKGNIDTMARSLRIPVRDVTAESLDSLARCLKIPVMN